MHFIPFLFENAAKHPDLPFFKDYAESPASPVWKSTSFKTFLHDVDRAARFLRKTLNDFGVKVNDTVGIWIAGSRYEVLVYLLSVSRAGYVAQILRPGLEAYVGAGVNNFLCNEGTKALVYDPFYQDYICDMSVPTLAFTKLSYLLETMTEEQYPMIDMPEADDDAIAVIHHTSGTTLGRPKPVPQTHGWLFSQLSLAPRPWPSVEEGQNCLNHVGSFAHIAGFLSIIRSLARCSCSVRTEKFNFEADELVAMVKNEGLTNLVLLGCNLSRFIRIARSDAHVLDVLQSIQEVLYTGEGLSPVDVSWAVENGLRIRNMLANTEVGLCLVSFLEEEHFLPAMRLVPETNIRLIPIQAFEVDLEDQRGLRLLEVFVPATSPNCPHPSIRNRPDGHVTGDLFEETMPGYYVFRGRRDDWIKSGRGGILGLCDTKGIEDAVRLNCADIIYNCVVVGAGKPVVLFVESLQGHPMENSDGLKIEIIKRMENFEATLFAHERFNDRVVVVEQGSLPRTSTKGNTIKRNGVEELYADTLREIYSKAEGA